MTKKLSIFLLIITLISNNINAFANVNEKYQWVVDQYSDSYENLLWQKVWFLVEWTNTNWRIKRSEEGYLIDNFLKNDSVKNINSWFNWDYWNIRLETSSQANIASYFPSVFDWNIPYKIYEIKNWEINKDSWISIYWETEKENLCTYGFTRSIDSVNDITTKVDVYWLSEDWNKLIGKDTYNSTILNQIENKANWDIQKVNEFINAVNKNAILIEEDWKHEIYNYSNYWWNLKQSIMWPDMSKYSINSYLEKNFNNFSIFDSEIRFTETEASQTSNLENWKYWYHISYQKDNNTEEEKYYIINKNNLVKTNWEIDTLDINKLFIQYKDLINWFSNVDSQIVSNIKREYSQNIKSWISKMIDTDTNKLYEKWRIKNSLLLIEIYLTNLWLSVQENFRNQLYNTEIYNSLELPELTKLVAIYYSKFLSSLELKFTSLHTDKNWNSKIVPLEWNFRQEWAIWTLDDILTNVWFQLYSTDWEDTEFSFDNTITYWDLGSSFWVFPSIKLTSWDKVSFLMWFALPWEPNDDIKKLYNTIIWGSNLAMKYIDNKEYNYVYWLRDLLKQSPYKSWKLNLKFLYNSAWILDFFFKYDLNDANVLEDNNFKTLLAMSFNYFNNWDAYNIRDISKSKLTTKQPYVFPVSYFIWKEEREYSYYNSELKKLKHWETSYFKICLSDKNIKKLLKATPESSVYTKKISQNWKEFLITYKVLEMQYKFAWELTMWSDFWFYWDMPPEQSINLWNFMNNNPLKKLTFKNENLKIENFLSWKNINIWSGFINRNIDKYSYWFRVFSKAWDNLITYKENGASNKIYDPNSWHLFNPVINTLTKIEWNNFWDGSWKSIIETWKKDTTFGEFNYTSDLYSTVSCPKWYDLYDDYKPIYEEIYKIINSTDNNKKNYNTYPLLEKLNYRKLNWIDYQQITGYFNVPRPFCIHSSLNKNKETVIKSILKMFTVDEWSDNLSPIDKYNYILQNNTNPFLYYDEEKWNFKFSTTYLNTLRSLFTSEYQRFPTYNKISENLDKIYTWDLTKEILWYVNYSDNIDDIIDNLLLYNIKKIDENGINFQSRYDSQKIKLKSILSWLNKVYFSWIYGINLLKNSSWNPEDFTNSANADIFPIIAAIKTIKKAWIDFYCMDSDWTKTNSIILKWKCISKNTWNYANNEKLYINNWNNIALPSWAFVNNTTLLPFFKPGISIKDTSWTLFLNKDVSSQEQLPFIKKTNFDPNIDDINLKPRITALRWISSSEMIENQLNQWYWYRAWWFLYPYSKFIIWNNKINFNNLLINSSIDLSNIQNCTNIFNPNDKTGLQDWTCPIWYYIGYSNWINAPFVINNWNSDSLWVKNQDYYTLNVPLAFWDIQTNKDMEYYANSNILNTKAEFVAWKSSIFVYNWDYNQKNKWIELLTWYVNSDKIIDSWDFLFLSIDNSSTWLNNNSVFYEVKSDFIPEVCIFWNDNINACIEEYNTYDTTFINRASNEDITNNEKVCLELNWTKRIYTEWHESENDIDQTWYCNLSCTTVDWKEKIFSSNNYYLYTKNQWDSICLETKPTKLKIFDWYSLNNFLEKNSTSVNLGKYYESWTGSNWTWIPINSSLWTCYYDNTIKSIDLSCTKWFLSKYNNEISKVSDDLKTNPAYRNSYNYAYNLELGKKVSSNFNWVLNNDLIVLTSNQSILNGKEPTIEWGYIWYNSTIIDDTNWGIKEPYLFSDNDNLHWEWQVYNNISMKKTDTKIWRQERRDRLKDQLKLSAWTENDLTANPTYWLNYIAYKVNKDDFYSLNWIIRIAKDSTKYFSNVKIQNPLNEEELLVDVNIYETIFSHNNLTIKYGNKFYTWWDNDAYCNWINPNEVYNKIDMYSNDKKNSREDTITICLDNKDNLSQKHEIKNDIYILLPIKPTKWYNKYNTNWSVELDNPSNNLINNDNGYINDMLTSRDSKFNLNTYFQWYFTNVFKTLDSWDNFLEVSYWGKITNFSDRAVKWRKIDLQIQNSPKKSCYYTTCWLEHCYTHTVNYYEYRWTGTKSYNVNFKTNKIILNNIPKLLANWFITKQIKDKWIFALPSYFSNSNTLFNNNSNSTNLWYTDYISPLSYSSCKTISNWINEAQEQVKTDLVNIANIDNQSQIKIWSFTLNNSLEIYNKWNVINSFYIPPVENITDYSNSIIYTSTIKDSYYKAWNLLNNLGLIKSNEDYIKASLKENNYKVNVWDYLEFEQKINVTEDIIPQLMFIKTQLDRWLDLDISTLEFTKNWYKQSPIYANNDENKEIIWNKYNSKFIISNINNSSNNEQTVFTTKDNNKYNDTITLTKNNKITVTDWKLFLEVLSPQAKVFGTKGTKYWRGGTQDINLIFERNNWIVKEEDLSDIFTDLGTTLQKWDILTIWAGEYIRFADNNISLKIIWFNSLPEYLLNYDKKKVMQKDQIVWIPYIDSWFTKFKINPSKTQPYYVFKCDKLDDLERFKKSNTIIDFTDSIGSEYCWVYNKYSDNVFNGYLNTMSSYNRLVMPSEEYRFSYWDEYDNNSKLLWEQGKYNNISLARTSRWYMNWDREKQLLVNLWLVKKDDIITIKYKAKINKYNDIWHILYNYDDIDSKSLKNLNEDNDTLLWNIHNKNNDIYTKALKTQLLFLTHYWDEEKVYDKEQVFDDWKSIKWKIEITPNIDISIVNLSWRKWYIWCNPINETPWKCDQFYSLETFNRDWEDNSSKWEVIKKDWESQVILYKGQKFFLRTTIANNFIEKWNLDNSLKNLKLKLLYNSDLVLFDWIVLENSFNSDNNLIQNSLWNKTTLIPEDLDSDLKTIITNRKDYIQDIQNSSVTKSYKQINYSINTSKFNWEGWITVDYLFTIKNTLNAENIKDLFWTAFLKDIWWIFIVTSEFEKNENKEYLFPTNHWNSAYINWEDYDWTKKTVISDLFNNKYESIKSNNNNELGWYSFQFFKMPFTENYKFLEESDNMITNLNPKLAVFNARIVNLWWNIKGVYTWDISD